MNIAEAREKLKEIAGGEYRSLDYEEVIHRDGTVNTIRKVYVAGRGFHSADTWDEALSALQDEIDGVVNPGPDLEQDI